MDFSIQIPFNFKPRPYQLRDYQLMDSGCKRSFKRWTRRAGKDLGDWNYMIKKAFERIGNYFYVFPSYTQGKKAIWEGKTKNEYKYLDYIPPGMIASKNSNEMKIELLNGSIIRIVGTEDIASLRGAGPCGIVISEFAYHTDGKAMLDALTPMLEENNGWLIINSTPRGKNFMYDFEMSIVGNKDWNISEIQSLWPDLPNYYPVYTLPELDKALEEGTISYEDFLVEATKQTMAAIDRERAIKDEEMIEQEYGVSYIAGQKGAYYSEAIIKARKEGRIGTFSHNSNKPVDILLDLGRKDDTAIWFRQIDGNRIIWIDYYEMNNQDFAFYARLLKEKKDELKYNYRAIVMPHDGKAHTLQTKYSNTELFRRLLLEWGIDALMIECDRPLSKQLPITLTRERFAAYHFNEPMVSDGLKKLSLYHREYDKKNKVFKDYPAHDWTSHASDAIALDALTQDEFSNYSTLAKPMEIITEFNPLDYEEKHNGN